MRRSYGWDQSTFQRLTKGKISRNTKKHKLVRSSLSDPPCPSGKRKCNTCCALHNGRCTDKNVVYELKCKLCGATYVGESKRPLRLHFNKHSRSALNNTELTLLGIILARVMGMSLKVKRMPVCHWKSKY